jgi:transcriptional regulator with XRE-family HTH domain
MSTAERIRRRREELGKSDVEVAERLGVNDASYADLELHDDELTSVLSLSQAMTLASILNVSLDSLLGVEGFRGDDLPFTELPRLIKSRLSSSEISFEDFEDEVGWQLDQFMESPLRTALGCPIMFLQDLAKGLALDWRAIIPRGNAV